MKTNNIYYSVILFLLLCFYSCAGNMGGDDMRPLFGRWITENGLEMSIRPTPYTGVSAVIVSSGAFIGEETKIGSIILSEIKPLVDGGYGGKFQVPGQVKPYKVKIVFLGRDTLLISLWDLRKMGQSMKWQRIRNEKK